MPGLAMAQSRDGVADATRGLDRPRDPDGPEIVLGIDNIVSISVVTGRLPKHQQARARTIGLGLALGMRVALLLTVSWVIGLTAPLFSIAGQEISGRDLILILGGLLLTGPRSGPRPSD
jgi:predicted tellurium resistance membrane protein TerC